MHSKRSVRSFGAAVLGLSLCGASIADSNIDAAIDKIFSGQDSTHKPGCAVGVMRKGELVFQRGYGMADLERNVPVTTDSVFLIASVSKQFTAASIALLEGQGKLS